MLSSYRGKCPFRVYILSKPVKYGFKIWIVADIPTAYCSFFQVYLGKTGSAPEKNQGSRVVKDLCQHMYDSGRNVTMDNLFTDVTLAQDLLQRRMTIVGTMRKSRAAIPREMLPDRHREVTSSLFGFHDQMTIVSYVPKRNKSVVLLSTMHHDNKISLADDKKPDIILNYNSTKGAVDTLDKMCRQYSTKRGTRRWPLSLFYSLLDIAAHNSSVVWFACHPEWQTGFKDRRRRFILEMGKALCLPLVQSRRNNPAICYQPQVKRALEYLGMPPPKHPVVAHQEDRCRGRCYLCNRHKEMKVNNKCEKCGRFVCGSHGDKKTVYTCKVECDNDDV
jgi:hypothetical protein